MKHFDHVILYLFFCIKNKWQLHTNYPKREVPWKSIQISFLRAPQVLQSLTVATPLGMSRAKLHVRLQWPNIYPCHLHDFAWYCCLFIYLFLEMFVWYLCLCCHDCLLRAFPNCHSVCHQNNKYVCTHLNNMVVVTMDHRSSLDSGTQWRNH